MTQLAIPFPDDLLDLLTKEVARRIAEQQPQQQAAPLYLTVREAADLIRAKPQRIYDLVSAGRLTRHKDGARLLIARGELDEYLQGHGR